PVGVTVEAGSAPSFRSVTARGSTERAAVVTGEASMTVRGLRCTVAAGGGLLVQDGAKIDGRDLVVDAGAGTALELTGPARGTLREARLGGTADSAVTVGSGASLSLESAVVRGAGLRVGDGAEARL